MKCCVAFPTVEWGENNKSDSSESCTTVLYSYYVIAYDIPKSAVKFKFKKLNLKYQRPTDVRTRSWRDSRRPSRIQVVRRLSRQGQGGEYIYSSSAQSTMLIDTVARYPRITSDTASMHPQDDGRRTRTFIGITVKWLKPKLSARKRSGKSRSLRQMP